MAANAQSTDATRLSASGTLAEGVQKLAALVAGDDPQGRGASPLSNFA